MAEAKKIKKEIESLTSDLILSGLCIDQNYPVITKSSDDEEEIGFGKLQDLSITLKNIPYHEAYSVLIHKISYNIKLIDGGIIQILYRFKKEEILNHRLAFFPSPDLLEYQNNSDIYENDEMYGDVIYRNVVTTPIRFDFDKKSFVDCDHPMSHLTVGQYKNCRIPVSGPLSPFYFLHFILRSFYNTPFKKFCGEISEFIHDLPETITQNEMKHIHLQIQNLG